MNLFVTDVVSSNQVSSVTDHVGSQDTTAKSADFDDDEGGLVSFHLLIEVFKNWS